MLGRMVRLFIGDQKGGAMTLVQFTIDLGQDLVNRYFYVLMVNERMSSPRTESTPRLSLSM